MILAWPLLLKMLLDVGLAYGASIGGSPIGRSVRLSPKRTFVCIIRCLEPWFIALSFWDKALSLSPMDILSVVALRLLLLLFVAVVVGIDPGVVACCGCVLNLFADVVIAVVAAFAVVAC